MASIYRFILLLILLLSGAVGAWGQGVALSGRVVDGEDGEGLAKATVQLFALSSRKGGGVDTTFVSGTYTDAQGQFSFSGVKAGSFLMRLSYLGYKTLERAVTVTRGRQQALDTLKMEADAVMLGEAVVTANEVGGGVVPMDPEERAWREACGRALCVLAGHADQVTRVVCGIGVRIK